MKKLILLLILALNIVSCEIGGEKKTDDNSNSNTIDNAYVNRLSNYDYSVYLNGQGETEKIIFRGHSRTLTITPLNYPVIFIDYQSERVVINEDRGAGSMDYLGTLVYKTLDTIIIEYDDFSGDDVFEAKRIITINNLD
tara:strand:- start:2616 stop:3032 length:417 start_codon:yes stop_codon:yes gene_type:complete